MTKLVYHRFLLAFGLLAFFWLGVHSALQKSPTADEPVHLTRGITLWQTGDFRFQQEHTPFSHWLIGLMAHTEPGLPDVTTLPGWGSAERLPAARALVWERGLDVTRLFFLGRIGILWLGLLTIALLGHWVGETAGRRAGLVAVGLFAFDPNLLAHGGLATTDFTATAGYVIALYGVTRLAQRRSWLTWLLAGLGLGIGLSAKMTGLLLLPLAGAVLFFSKFRVAGEKFAFKSLWGWLAAALREFLTLLPLAGLVVWAVYRFTAAPVYIPQLDAALTLPAPAYWQSLLGVNAHIEGGHRAFFMGEVGSAGWYAYFLVAFLLKTPLFLLLLLPAALWQTARRRAWAADLPFWLPPLVLLAFASYTRLNIGYRHILPVVPLLIGWVGVGLGRLKPAVLRRALPLVMAAAALPALLVSPHFLAYFNLLAGGPGGGYRYLGDSNLDWGQDWQLAARYVKQNEIQTPYILPSGFVEPAYYGLDAPSLLDAAGFPAGWFSPANPPAGTYLLSVNGLQGVLAEPDLLDRFRRLEPVEKRATGYSIFVYDVPARDEGGWVAHCTDPGPLLSPAEAEQLLGRDGLRHIYFDCRSSWVFPGEGAAGWLILPREEAPWWPQTVYGDALAEVYSHRATAAAPSYELLYWDGMSAEEIAAAVAVPAPAPAAGDPADLLGGWPADGVWRTAWRVNEATGRPLSVRGHLYTGGETPAGVADGLGYAANQWEPGDIFIQYHIFDPALPAGELETGLYDYTSGETASGVVRLRP